MQRVTRRATADARQRSEGGYVAILTILLFTTLFGLCAFAVDVGNWYYTGQRAQRAADAAALAGVPMLPGDPSGAFAEARTYAKANGFDNASSTVQVDTSIDGQPTRLRVTTSMTVQNQFGSLFGIGHTTISRTAVADYAGPVPMGSPCNEFGNDPESTGYRGSTCSGVSGQFWASVNSPSTDKGNGDQYQSLNCGSGVDGCSSGSNTEYEPNGYYYTVHVTQATQNLTLQAFDPEWANVGLTCGSNFGSGSTAATAASNNWVSDAATRYKSGSSEPYCTGDNSYGGSGVMNTQFTVRAPSPQPWDPTTFPVISGCQKTYAGYSGALYNALNKTSGGYRDDIAKTFRRWDTLCTIPNAVPGDYLIQVQTNGLGTDSTNQGNRFALRAFSTSDTNAKNLVSVSGRERMSIFSNAPSAITEFYLARIQSATAGQILQIKLFDVGDSTQPGTIQLVAPPDSGSTFTNCTAVGGSTGPNLPTCSFTVTNATHQGKLVTIQIPIPANYSCGDSDPTKCWVRLRYVYGSGSAPTDVTSWSANIFGDPVRLVE